MTSAERIDDRLDPKKASAAEMRGQAIFFGEGACASGGALTARA